MAERCHFEYLVDGATFEESLSIVETNTSKIIARLEREGWVNQGGSRHDKFRHPDRPGQFITVPRHRTVSPGVARSIAKAAGWKE